MRIGLDFDGVISDCGSLKCLAAKTMYGVDIPSSDFKKELVVGRGLLTMPQYRDLQNAIYGTWEYGRRMEPVPGVLEGISALRSAGHEVRVVTSREGEMLKIAQDWAVSRGIELAFEGVGHDKSKAVAAAGLDVFIDDDLDKLEPLVDIVPHRFLFSWGYNSHIEAGDVARRVASWQEFLGHIDALTNPK